MDLLPYSLCNQVSSLETIFHCGSLPIPRRACCVSLELAWKPPASKKCIHHKSLVWFPDNTGLLYTFFLPKVLSSSFSSAGVSNFQCLLFNKLLLFCNLQGAVSFILQIPYLQSFTNLTTVHKTFFRPLPPKCKNIVYRKSRGRT